MTSSDIGCQSLPIATYHHRFDTLRTVRHEAAVNLRAPHSNRRQYDSKSQVIYHDITIKLRVISIGYYHMSLHNPAQTCDICETSLCSYK